MSSLATRLGSLGAYRDLVAWCEPHGDDVTGALAACPRGDWVIAIAIAEGAPHPDIVRAACACADLATELVEPAAIGAALRAVEAARAWADTGAPLAADVVAACEELAGHPDPLVQSAAIAGLACALSVGDRREAPAAASGAVSAAALHAAECGAMAAVAYTHARTAELARAALSGTATGG